ncbi:hypothetical protein [Pseudobacteriovorax antillogorgiicola]|uniref:Lipoprotein n=1 Tax=Pseudobacteriovorax antillogorgiicola TaxID=1513793 RepID=A0A1Y6CR22_9BACT|nr:hypothetical protein [Pseudobacteriovorax antillogorgiicola]TCS40846.1 hypothetical protein EDD56_1539 [Pseudobacteriovorax antillogorgiicola]SMF84318.1 hypothetical protein SAMN06296036_15310 [Pseudobacteriovorax antillogorgiicola]
MKKQLLVVSALSLLAACGSDSSKNSNDNGGSDAGLEQKLLATSCNDGEFADVEKSLFSDLYLSQKSGKSFLVMKNDTCRYSAQLTQSDSEVTVGETSHEGSICSDSLSISDNPYKDLKVGDQCSVLVQKSSSQCLGKPNYLLFGNKNCNLLNNFEKPNYMDLFFFEGERLPDLNGNMAAGNKYLQSFGSEDFIVIEEEGNHFHHYQERFPVRDGEDRFIRTSGKWTTEGKTVSFEGLGKGKFMSDRLKFCIEINNEVLKLPKSAGQI